MVAPPGIIFRTCPTVRLPASAACSRSMKTSFTEPEQTIRICQAPVWSRPPDGGTTWTHTDLSPHADNLIDVCFSDENTGWIVGGKKQPSCPVNKPGYETYPQYAQLKPVVLKTTDGGATMGKQGRPAWPVPIAANGVGRSSFLDAMTGFVSLENFTGAAILKTTDGGETWVRIADCRQFRKIDQRGSRGRRFRRWAIRLGRRMEQQLRGSLQQL